MKRIIILSASFFITLLVKGQVNNFNKTPITFPSPDAMQFIRYGNIPVDYSTGVPGISIPIHTVTCGKLSLPIDISYNASGIKVADVAGTAGLGWSVNAGGLVTRTIIGTNDQLNKPKPFLSASDITTAINLGLTGMNGCTDFIQTTEQIFGQYLETQSDRYFYNFNGRSGIFRSDFQSGVLKTIPYSALKISAGTNNVGPYKITDEDGTIYYLTNRNFLIPTPETAVTFLII